MTDTSGDIASRNRKACLYTDIPGQPVLYNHFPFLWEWLHKDIFLCEHNSNNVGYCAGAVIWALVVFICKMMGLIYVNGWTTLFMFNLFSFGIIMLTLGILGSYLWRTFDASRNRPPYIIEEHNLNEK